MIDHTKNESGFTTTNEAENENLFSFLPSAVGEKPASDQKVAGFTLVELIVSIGIFAVVMTVALSGLMSVVDSSRQARARSAAVNSLNFVVDDMIRRIRTGYNFGCGSDGQGDCANGDDEFSFTSSEVGEDADTNPRVTYRVSEGQIRRTIGGGDGEQMTADPLHDIDLTFYVTGTDTGSDGQQSRVLISISGSVGEGDDEQSFSIQTSVAQRLLYSPSE